MTDCLIHPTAMIHPTAQLAPNVQVGPYSVIGEGVVIGAGTVVGNHTIIVGDTTIGERNRIYHFCSIGEENQDKKSKAERTRTVIGDDNTIREYVSIHRGSIQDRGETTVGSRNWIMAHCHIAHDCVVGDDCTFANHATLAGHVWIGHWVTLGGFVGVHQFCKVGDHVMAGVSAVILQDVPPFVLVTGNPCEPRAINSEGLKRRGFAADEIAAAKRAYRVLYREKRPFAEALEWIRAESATQPKLAVLLSFLEQSTRGIVR